mmetsp:Transcript_91096/g.181119  ORF Transcript_91096/g.181119 Transcript_91096/m.181119 type:complete len:157 (+) Transcript_91096:66-536(+)
MLALRTIRQDTPLTAKHFSAHATTFGTLKPNLSVHEPPGADAPKMLILVICNPVDDHRSVAHGRFETGLDHSRQPELDLDVDLVSQPPVDVWVVTKSEPEDHPSEPEEHLSELGCGRNLRSLTAMRDAPITNIMATPAITRFGETALATPPKSGPS